VGLTSEAGPFSIQEKVIRGCKPAGIAEKMLLKDNSKVSANYLELFFNGIAKRTHQTDLQ